MKYWLRPNQEFLPSTGFSRTGRVVTRYQLPMTEWSGPGGMGALSLLASASPTLAKTTSPVLSSAKVSTPMLVQPVATTKEQMVVNQTVASVAALFTKPGESASTPIVQPVVSQPSTVQQIIQAQQQAAVVNAVQAAIAPQLRPASVYDQVAAKLQPVPVAVPVSASLLPSSSGSGILQQPNQVVQAPSLPQIPAPTATASIPTMTFSPQPALKAEMVSPGVISVQEPVREPYNDDPVSPIHSVTMEVEQPALTSSIAATVGTALRRTTYAPTPAPVRAPYNDDPAYVPPSPCSPGYWYNEETGECQQYQLTNEDPGFVLNEVESASPIQPHSTETPRKTNWLLWGAVGLGVGGLIWYLTR